MQLQRANTGSTIVVALSTTLVISIIGAGVLMNSTARYNVATKQVKGWKEALYAAESGGDIAFAEVQKLVTNPGAAFSGWTSPAASPAPTPGPSYSKGPYTFGANNSLSTSVTVDKFYTDSDGGDYYRIRSVGTAKLFGFPTTGLDAALDRSGSHFTAGGTRGNGDTLLRKIDFKYDHFKATYGDGDGNSPALQTVANPQISRRIELIAAPQFAFTGALKATNSFTGPGSAGVIDSYDSKNGAYTFVANNPSSPLYADSHSGDVSVGTGNFQEPGIIYGNVTTNGGNVTHSTANISGTIDNNVPFTLPPLVRPDTTGFNATMGSTINPPAGTTAGNPATYYYSTISGSLTINGRTVPAGLPNAGKPAETYVVIVVGAAGATNGNITPSTLTVAKGVNVKIYFTGNFNMKAKDLSNNNVDGAAGVYNPDGTASTNYSRAAHLQFYGISPTNGSTTTIAVGSPGDVWATFYAPNSSMSLTGNPDVFGAIAVRDFNGNGNTGFHWDKQIIQEGIPVGYQIVSYVEDVR